MSGEVYDVVCAGVVYLDLTFAGLAGLPRLGEELWAAELQWSPAEARVNPLEQTAPQPTTA